MIDLGTVIISLLASATTATACLLYCRAKLTELRDECEENKIVILDMLKRESKALDREKELAGHYHSLNHAVDTLYDMYDELAPDANSKRRREHHAENS